MNDSNDPKPTPSSKHPAFFERTTETNPPPPIISHTDPNRPLGTDPEEHAPIRGIVAAAEAILRQPRRVVFQLRQQRQGRLILALVVVALICSVVYGLVVGTFSGGGQYWAAPIKVAVGLLVSALICLPSLYIFSCLSGSQARLVEVFGLVTGLLALTTVLLIGFAPVAWVFSQSTQSVVIMGSLHLAFWVVASCFGLRFLHTGFGQMRNTRSEAGGAFQVWVVIFLLVALQMTTALRPIVGTADRFLPAATEKKFFLTYWVDCFKGESSGQTGTPSR
ncbi:MAG: ABC-type transport system, permease component [Pedosphaera sp.]|nr:ABC-type transport system, permease component [Pedosphaera sp.]